MHEEFTDEGGAFYISRHTVRTYIVKNSALSLNYELEGVPASFPSEVANFSCRICPHHNPLEHVIRHSGRGFGLKSSSTLLHHPQVSKNHDRRRNNERGHHCD